MFTKPKICVNEKLNKKDKYINYLKYIFAYNNIMSTRKQMNSTMKSAKKYSSYFGGDSDNENMSGGDDRDPEVDYEEYESEAEEDSVDGDKKSKPVVGDEEGADVVGDDDSGAEDDESEEDDGNDEEPGEDVEDLDAPIDTEDEDDDEDESDEGEDEEQGEEEGNNALRPYARKPVPARNRKPVQNPVNVYSKSDDSEGEGEDDEDEDENYLQKFNAEINKEYIIDYHPECVISNYDEIATLAKVVRDKNGNIVDDLHRTPPYLTKYERARILGQRAKQINSGAPVYVKAQEKVIDGYLIAETELRSKLIPFIIRRPLPNGGSEYWKVADLDNVAF